MLIGVLFYSKTYGVKNFVSMTSTNKISSLRDLHTIGGGEFVKV